MSTVTIDRAGNNCEFQEDTRKNVFRGERGLWPPNCGQGLISTDLKRGQVFLAPPNIWSHEDLSPICNICSIRNFSAFCSVLRHFVAFCGILRHFCGILQHFAAFLRHFAGFCGILRHFAAFCGKLVMTASAPQKMFVTSHNNIE